MSPRLFLEFRKVSIWTSQGKLNVKNTFRLFGSSPEMDNPNQFIITDWLRVKQEEQTHELYQTIISDIE